MAVMKKEAITKYPQITEYNVVFGMDPDEYFTADYIATKLKALGVTMSSGKIEQDLRRWSRAGKLARFCGAYAVVP